MRYNDLDLRVVKTDSYSRTPVYDNFTYLYTKHALRVQAIYNPGYTSAWLQDQNVLGGGEDLNQPPAAVNRAPRQELGHNPAISDVALRHYLSQPRKQLVYTAAGEDPFGDPAYVRDGLRNEQLIILRSPLPRTDGVAFIYDCDSNCGPFPTVHGVSQVGGTKTFRVWWSVETALNEASLYVPKPPLLVSQNWSVRDSVDADWYTTRTIRGTVVLRRDLLQQQQIFPDDLRAAIASHPVATNSRREFVDWYLRDDGCTIEYVLVDKEKATLPGAYGLSRVEAWAEVGVDEGASWVTALPDIARGLTAAVTGQASKVLASGAAVVGALLPTTSVSLVVKVWGNRSLHARQLLNAAVRVFQAKFPAANKPEFRGLWSVRDNCRIELTGTFLEMRATYVCSKIGSTYQGINSVCYIPDKFNELLEPDCGDVWTGQTRAGKAPPGGFARGTLLDRAVTQKLWGGDTYPPGPPAVKPYEDRALPL